MAEVVGACGIAAAKPSEAEVFVDGGCRERGPRISDRRAGQVGTAGAHGALREGDRERRQRARERGGLSDAAVAEDVTLQTRDRDLLGALPLRHRSRRLCRDQCVRPGSSRRSRASSSRASRPIAASSRAARSDDDEEAGHEEGELASIWPTGRAPTASRSARSRPAGRSPAAAPPRCPGSPRSGQGRTCSPTPCRSSSARRASRTWPSSSWRRSSYPALRMGHRRRRLEDVQRRQGLVGGKRGRAAPWPRRSTTTWPSCASPRSTGWRRSATASVELGEKLRFTPFHICTAVNLSDALSACAMESSRRSGRRRPRQTT